MSIDQVSIELSISIPGSTPGNTNTTVVLSKYLSLPGTVQQNIFHDRFIITNHTVVFVLEPVLIEWFALP